MSTSTDSLKIEIILKDISGEEKKVTSVKSLDAFVQKELTYWQEIRTKWKNEPINQIVTQVNSAMNELNAFRTGFDQWDENQKNQQLRSMPAKVQQAFANVPFSNTPFTAALVEVCILGQHQTQIFWNFLTKQGNGQLPGSSVDYIEGLIAAYEFKNQEESIIYKRREGEKRVLANLRKMLSDKTDELVTETDELQRKIRVEADAFKNEIEEWKSVTQTDLQEKITSDGEFRKNFFEEATTRLDEMETLYKEKLKLEGPADYWRKQATKHKEAGKKWARALALTTALSALVFISLFSQWLASGKHVEKLSALHWQGVILLGAVLSLAIFMIKTFSRLTFSSFHLQQDAEEREQLAYFYLALSHETEFSDESRKIVFQALFSRADSGLLAGEHGPTMPVTEVFKQMKS